MKLSFDWLGDFVDLSGLSPQEVADKLTMGAFEVEEIKTVGPDIQGPLVVGEILEINPHPNADKIRVTKTRIAEGAEPQEIVCGAWNIEVGHKIPVALPGAKVLNRHDGSALHIKQSQIRGITSNGMLCSAPELGITGDGEGIYLLDKDTKIGIDAKDLLGIQNDYVLIVEPRSNRGDALSVLGLAREVAALFARPLKKQSWLEEFESIALDPDLAAVETRIDDLEACPFFTIRTLGKMTIAESPSFIKRRLEAIGIKTINNMVDVTNYVLHELGQPLHAYDMNKLAGRSLIVRRGKSTDAGNEEILKTIDDKERKIPAEALVIADGKVIVGVAGVMGGKDSEISESTVEVALEAASFAPSVVRRSSRTIGLSSDSSLRFERGVDTASVQVASNRAAYLMSKFCGAKLGPLSSAGSDHVALPKVQIRMSELRRLCEIEMSADAAGELLEPLGFKASLSADDYNAGILTLQVPSYRLRDVTREVDLVEEICRLHGYDNIPVSMPNKTMAARPGDPIPGKIRNSFAASGLSEAWLSSLTSFDELQNKDFDTAVGVLNPLSPDHQVLRQSLIPGLVKAASYNQDRGNANPWLFEIGRVYFRHPDSPQFRKGRPENKLTFAEEEMMVSGIISGEPTISTWLNEKVNANADELHRPDMRSYFLIKGIFENLATALSIPPSGIRFETSDDLPSWLHPGRSAKIVFIPGASDNADEKKKGKKSAPITLGYLGELHPALSDSYKLSGRAAAIELKVQSLKESMKENRFSEIFVTPTMQRDLTADLDKRVANQDLDQCIRNCGGEILRKVELVSVFRLSDNNKSLSFRLTFQHPEQTLTADAVDAIMAKIRNELSLKLGASFRL